MAAAPNEKAPLRSTAPSHGTFAPHPGLTSKRAAELLKELGPNKLDAAEKESFLSILVVQCKNVIFLLTTIAASICFMTNEEVKASVLLGIVFVVCVSNAIGEYSGQDAGEALASLSAKNAQVLRDGNEVEVKAEELVDGDVVKISIGDKVPADMLLLEAVDVLVDQGLLTGESIEVRKSAEPIDTKEEEEAVFKKNILYKDTLVVAGAGKGEVIATGMRTQVGSIAKRLDKEPPQLNPLQKSINRLGVFIGGACTVMLVCAFLLSYFTRYQNPMNPCADDDEWCFVMGSIVRGLLMAVSLIPHGLPLVVMVMLRVGAMKMGEINAIVTKKTAVDYLGAATVICTDKTGTLTEGKMTAQEIIGLYRPSKDEQIKKVTVDFCPMCGIHPNGGIFAGGVLVEETRRQVEDKFDSKLLRQDFSIPGIADIGEELFTGKSSPSTEKSFLKANLACVFLTTHKSVMSSKEANTKWEITGNMTDAALKIAAAKGGLWEERGYGAELMSLIHPREPALEVPFTSKRKMCAGVVKLPENRRLETLQFPSDATHVAILQGAPDRVLPKLSFVLMARDGGFSVPGLRMSQQERDAVQEQNVSLANSALRGLLVAVCPLTAADVAAMQATKDDTDARLAMILDHRSLTALSLWGILDPHRKSVPPSVEECHTAGIRVVMITGDFENTAVAIGRKVHILDDQIKGSTPCTSMHEKHPQLPASEHVSSKALQRLNSTPNVQERRPNMSPEKSEKTLSVHDDRTVNKQEAHYLPDEQLAQLTSSIHVWSRAQPTDKRAIVDSLQKQGHVTAMTGDGVNDAPALTKAGVGVAMGSGTAVAQQASELILQDDNFSTIVAAIKEGRRIYNNTQKYVVFNLSVKFSECSCLFAAILLGVPMPIRGLQLLLNLVVTHILPPMSLAWEPAESYLMRIPPRKTEGDLVVSKAQWLARWLPYVLYSPIVIMSSLALGVWAHTGFVDAGDLIGTSRVGFLSEGKVACEYAGTIHPDGSLTEDLTPFHCRCFVHDGGMPWASVKQVDQWGSTGYQSELSRTFDRWTGDTGSLFKQENTPWKAGMESILEPCSDHLGVSRWCWKKFHADFKPENRPVLPNGMHCAAYGAQLGQTMSYVTIHLGEILSLLSYRMNAFFLPHTFTNHIYLGFFVFNMIALCLALYVEPVTTTLQLAPLTLSRLALAVCFPFCLMALNETAKIFYRMLLDSTNRTAEEEAKRRSLGGALYLDEEPAKKIQ